MIELVLGKEFGPDMRAAGKALGSRDLPFVISLALNRTAKVAAADVYAVMRQVFDRPTPFALRSLRLARASKTDLRATIYFRDRGDKGSAARDYLDPQILGRGRRHKRSERSLQHAGLLRPGWFAVPGPAAQLDQYGNMRRGQIVKLLSFLGASSDTTQNRSVSGKSRGSRARESYYAVPDKGVFLRRGKGAVLVLAFRPDVSYRARLPFERVVASSAKAHLPEQLRAAIAQAIDIRRARGW